MYSQGQLLDEQAPSADLVEKIFQREGPADGLPPSSDIDSTSQSGDHSDTEVTVPGPTVVKAKDEAPMATVDTTPSIVSQVPDNPVDSSIVKAASQDDAAAAHDRSSPSDMKSTVAAGKVVASAIDTTPSVVSVTSGPSKDTVGDSAHEAVVHGRSWQSDVESTKVEDKASTFYVDTTPSMVDLSSHSSKYMADNSVIQAAPLGEVADDDVIVYEAPHPRLSGRAPSQPAASTSNVVHLDTPSPHTHPTNPHQHSGAGLLLSKHVQAPKAIGLKPTPRLRKLAKKARAAARRREQRTAMFSMTSFGLNMEERAALQEGSTVKGDPLYAERRRGDSDLDWGTDDEGEIEEVCSGIGEMELDSEVGDISMLARVVRRRVEGEEVVTIADLEDSARMKEEDEETGSDEGSSQEEEDVFDAAERKEIGEGDDADSSDSSEEDTPRRSFLGRLQKMRGKGKIKTITQASLSSDEEKDIDEVAAFGPHMSWADRDERYLEHIDVSGQTGVSAFPSDLIPGFTQRECISTTWGGPQG